MVNFLKRIRAFLIALSLFKISISLSEIQVLKDIIIAFKREALHAFSLNGIAFPENIPVV